MEDRQRQALERFGLDPDQLIHQDGRYWMTADQLGTALGYRNPSRAVRTLIDRHHKELRPFIGGLKLVPPSGKGGPQDTTVIDTDGQYRIAILANTPQAARFRTFVVNMLRALERQEFVHVSQVREWQDALLDQLTEWRDQLRDAEMTRYFKTNGNIGPEKFRRLLRYRDMGLTQRETGKLLDISRDTVRILEQRYHADPLGKVVSLFPEASARPHPKPYPMITEGGAA